MQPIPTDVGQRKHHKAFMKVKTWDCHKSVEMSETHHEGIFRTYVTLSPTTKEMKFIWSQNSMAYEDNEDVIVLLLTDHLITHQNELLHFWLYADVMFGGTETVALAIEWAMKKLMRSSEEMKSVQEELVLVGGFDQKSTMET